MSDLAVVVCSKSYLLLKKRLFFFYFFLFLFSFLYFLKLFEEGILIYFFTPSFLTQHALQLVVHVLLFHSYHIFTNKCLRLFLLCWFHMIIFFTFFFFILMSVIFFFNCTTIITTTTIVCRDRFLLLTFRII